MLLLLLALLSVGLPSFAQFASGPLSPAAGSAGELWSVTIVREVKGLEDREPSQRDQQRSLVCYARGTVASAATAKAELPAELKDKCWLSDQRTESRRQQTKYACNDGMSAEVATRHESDGSYGGQVIVNTPGQGGISITRTLRRVPGACDPSIKAPAPSAPPAPPATPSTETPAK